VIEVAGSSIVRHAAIERIDDASKSARPATIPGPPRRPDLRRLALGLGLFAIAVGGLVYGSALVVLYRAWAVADGRPACLVVARPEGYQPATGFTDLTILRMQAQPGFSGFTWRFHAVLLVTRRDGETDMFNWSWRRLVFDPAALSQANEALWPAADACAPGRRVAQGEPAHCLPGCRPGRADPA
jgi:hypothetical protein